jgi:hypothetical protein
MSRETIQLENGNSVHFKRDPRYGFWAVNFDKGGMPETLKGHYTSLIQAKSAVKNYLAVRPKNKTAPKE